jgi:lipid A 4'-phosphatase
MTRAGLAITLAIAAVVGITFVFFPEFDIALARKFHTSGYGGWVINWSSWGWHKLRDVASWLIALMVAPAVIAFVLKLLLPRWPLLLPGRAILLMTTTLALGPGLIANVVLKDNWGRPRPFNITEFGGTEQFRPWWDPRGSCQGNCSFVAGEPAAAFWTMAPAAVTPPAWRAAAYGAALAFGAGMGVLRMAAGGHFFTDVVFAGVFMFLLIWLMHGLLYRWRPTRISDDGVERALERIALPT